MNIKNLNIKNLLLIIKESSQVVRCGGYMDYLFYYPERDSWSVYNEYFTTKDVIEIVVTSKGLVEIVLE